MRDGRPKKNQPGRSAVQKLRILHQNQPIDNTMLFWCENLVHKCSVKYCCPRTSTDGRSVDAQMRQLITVGFRKLLREVARHSNYRSAIIARASGCRSGRAQVLPNCGGIRARLRRIRTGLWYRSDGPWHLCGSRATLHALRLWPCRPWHLMVADDHGPGRLIANMP